MTTQLPCGPLTVDDLQRMAEAGLLPPEERFELIDGEIRPMSRISSVHAAIVNRLSASLVGQVHDRAIVSVQNPILLSVDTEPQPDFALLRRRDDFYESALPGPEDILVLIEVSDTSLAYDRDEKMPRYAQAGIPEVWLIDVGRETITRSTRPQGTRYRHEQTLVRGQPLVSDAVEALELPFERIFW